MARSREKALRFLEAVGLSAAAVDVGALLDGFRAEMAAGLAGKPSSLAMIPTFIPVDKAVPAGVPVIALDAGGTHLRAATVVFDEAGRAESHDFTRARMPGADEELSAEAFFDRFVDILLPLAHSSDRVGFCFSYPAEITPEGDGLLLTWTKEINAPGVEGRYIGRSIGERLEARGIDLRFTLLNDTVAVLLAGRSLARSREFGSYAGFILGTGTNTAYVELNRRITKRDDLPSRGKQAVNVESGNFALCPQTEIDRALDAATNNPGEYTFEKMISGAYLGRLSLRLLKAADQDGLFSEEGGAVIRQARRLSTAQADRFLREPRGTGPLGSPALTGSDRETAAALIQAVIERAALLAAVNVAAAVLRSGAGLSSRHPVCINIDGSTYYKTFGLRSPMERHLQDLLGGRGVHFQPVRIPDSPLIGAAVAGLTRE
jgi:hexokinase